LISAIAAAVHLAKAAVVVLGIVATAGIQVNAARVAVATTGATARAVGPISQSLRVDLELRSTRAKTRTCVETGGLIGL
jgi:hypothetical protein